MKTHIYLEDLSIYAYHGVGPQETKVGNTFRLNLTLKVDISKAMQTDDVNDTVSYADVYHAISEEMAIPSKLLEHVAGRIVTRLFNDYPTIESIKLELAKLNPPMGADIIAAGVKIHCHRPA